MDNVERLMRAIQELSGPINDIKKKVDRHDEEISTIMRTVLPGRRLPIPPAGRGAYRGEWPITRDSDNDNGQRGTFGKILQAVYKQARGDTEAAEILDEFGVKWVDRAMQEDEPTEGGWLVPTEHEPEILRIPERGVIEPLCRSIPMGSKTRTVPKEETSVTSYWPAEEAEITESDAVLGGVTLIARKQAGLTTVSNELLEDSRPNVQEYLETIFTEAILLESDAKIISGPGDPCSGILTAVAGYSVIMTETSFSAITFDYLSEAISKLNPTVLADAVFALHPEILHYVRVLKDDQGAPIWSPAGGGPGAIYNYPIVDSSVMPGKADDAVSTPFISFFSPRGFIIGRRRGMTIAVNPYSKFQYDQTQIRWTRRVALHPAQPKRFVRILTGS